MTTYQSHNKASQHSNEIYQLKKRADKIARMKAAGTYCDHEDPDLSYFNFKMQSCGRCPNYDECKMESEKSSINILKYRRGNGKKPKITRKIKKECGCK